MIMFIPIIRIDRFDHENEDVMIRSSPIRLIDGGSARLARLPSIHHTPISGRIVCSP